MVNKIGTAKLNLFDSSNVNDNTSRIDCIFLNIAYWNANNWNSDNEWLWRQNKGTDRGFWFSQQ